MMKRGKSIIRNYMTMSYEFAGTRIQAGFLTPVDWELSVNLIVSGKKSKSKEEIEYKASVIYQKLYFWLDTNLSYITMVDVGNEDDLYLANLSSNIMLYCPGNPSDDLIVRLIHSKLSALAGVDMEIGEIKLKASDTSLQYTYDCPEHEYELPSTTTEYYTEGTCRDKDPWWLRDDGFCFEFVKPADSVETDEEIFAGIIDPMNEFERMISEMTDTHIGMVREPARIVQVEKWKPRKVE
jgi:hypothetical protein